MDELQQVHSVAAMLIEKYGVKAPSVAKHKALKAQQMGDRASANGWLSVARAVEALISGEAGQ